MMVQEDHDQRLKTAVKSKFSEAIDLLLPEWMPLFDFAHLEWLEQEIFPDPPKGKRRAIDILAKMPTLQPITTAAGETPAQACIGLVHVEVEGWETLTVMRRRMRDYRHYLSRKHHLPVLPLCIYMNLGLKGLGWDEYRETFFGEVIDTFRYRYLGLPALDGLQYIQGSNLLGVALAALMRIAEDAKARAKADALQKIATSNETEVRKYLLCECVDTYLPLEEVQMKEYEQLLISPPYQGARKYGKTSFELGREEGRLVGRQEFLQKLLTKRFGALGEEVTKRLEACSEEQLLEIAGQSSIVSSLRELGLEP